jgi:dihydroorotate dehydrogenase
MDADPKNADNYFLLLICRERNETAPQVPLLVKIAPDLTEEDMQDIASVLTSPDTRYIYPLFYVNFIFFGHRKLLT